MSLGLFQIEIHDFIQSVIEVFVMVFQFLPSFIFFGNATSIILGYDKFSPFIIITNSCLLLFNLGLCSRSSATVLDVKPA